MLTHALTLNPHTPAAVLAAVADRATYLPPWCQSALAAHPNLPTEHAAAHAAALKAALTRPGLPGARAAAIAAALPDELLGPLVLDAAAPHPAVPLEAWRRWGAVAMGVDGLTAIAAATTTPTSLALDALRALVTLHQPVRQPDRVTWAATRHPDHLHDLAARARDPHLAAALRTLAHARDPGADALAAQVDAARAGTRPWTTLVHTCGSDGATAALTEQTPDSLAAVAWANHIPPAMGVRALRNLGARGHLRDGILIAPEVLTARAGDLTDVDVAALLPVLHRFLWPAALGCPNLTANTLTWAWDASGQPDPEQGPGVFELAVTIAGHPASTARVRTEALELATATARPGDWSDADLALLAAANAVTVHPTGTPLPDLDDPSPGWRRVSGRVMPVVPNLARTLSAALTPDLEALATNPAAAAATAQLLESFTGTWEELMHAARVIAA